MKTKLFVQTSVVALAIILSSTSYAASVIYNTDSDSTGFAGGSTLSLSNSLGASALLVFTPIFDTAVGAPSNISYGTFSLLCPDCSNQSTGAGSFFMPFVFDLIISDVSHGAWGKFTGTSTGGTVFSDVSQITINWVPLQLGPFTNNAASGDFDTIKFVITSPTGIVAPNSGVFPGISTVQGFVDMDEVIPMPEIPEPATFGLIGASLLGFGLLRRKCFSGR